MGRRTSRQVTASTTPANELGLLIVDFILDTPGVLRFSKAVAACVCNA
jgi:hypothetical protein